jgi:hypothetical protein
MPMRQGGCAGGGAERPHVAEIKAARGGALYAQAVGDPIGDKALGKAVEVIDPDAAPIDLGAGGFDRRGGWPCGIGSRGGEVPSIVHSGRTLGVGMQPLPLQ